MLCVRVCYVTNDYYTVCYSIYNDVGLIIVPYNYSIYYSILLLLYFILIRYNYNGPCIIIHITPVSYTHLDVYKRQGYILAGNLPKHCHSKGPAVSFLARINDDQILASLEKFWETETVLDNACLLYTSRCV